MGGCSRLISLVVRRAKLQHYWSQSAVPPGYLYTFFLSLSKFNWEDWVGDGSLGSDLKWSKMTRIVIWDAKYNFINNLLCNIWSLVNWSVSCKRLKFYIIYIFFILLLIFWHHKIFFSDEFKFNQLITKSIGLRTRENWDRDSALGTSWNVEPLLFSSY